ncbi:MAG: flagellar assembly protein FliW [Deferribacteres bacterium]|nr:flagellar assembly protein FliW [Deferribacteres bacterium]
MISFDTTRFGRLEVARDKIIYFPNGLIGFPDVRRYILMDYKDTLLKWLQAVDAKDVAFIVAPTYEFFPDYSVKIDNQTRDLLGIENEEDVIILAILRVQGENVTANLQGPLVINSTSRKGVQVVNEDSRFSCRTPLKSLSSESE